MDKLTNKEELDLAKAVQACADVPSVWKTVHDYSMFNNLMDDEKNSDKKKPKKKTDKKKKESAYDEVVSLLKK